MPRSIAQPQAAKNIGERLAAVRARITAAEQRYGRSPGSVRLLAVSKTQPAEAIRAAARCGQRDFGENYLQEATDKMRALGAERLAWHFIGPIQANKTRGVAARFDWVHSLDRLKIARRLNEQRSPELPPLYVCIEVNLGGEHGKAGISPEELREFAAGVADLPRLKLRGLMTMPALTGDFSAQRQTFRRLRELLEELNAAGMSLDTLSMGTSQDLEAAIAEGATIVRIGTGVFGPRAPNAVRNTAHA
jgi:hypothetical protein